MIFDFIILLVSLLIGSLCGVYIWQELRKKFNNNIPLKLKKMPFIFGLLGMCCSYFFADTIYTIISLFLSL